jgi:hypothetical protein
MKASSAGDAASSLLFRLVRIIPSFSSKEKEFLFLLKSN